MVILFLIVFIGLVGFGIILPLFPFYAERFGASPEVITWTMAAFTLAQAVGTPIWGRISDAYGRRIVILRSAGVLPALSRPALKAGTKF